VKYKTKIIIMSAQDQRKQLINFINKKVFDPIINADPSKYDDNDRKKLAEVQDKTKKEQRKFEKDYKTANEVKENYLSDVSSDSAQKVDRELRHLHLPTLPGHKDEFEDLCHRLGV
jgi:hypothetical protein